MAAKKVSRRSKSKKSKPGRATRVRKVNPAKRKDDGNGYLMSDRSFEFDYKGTDGRRKQQPFDTQAEMDEFAEDFRKRKAEGREFLSKATQATFHQALVLVRENAETENFRGSTVETIESNIRTLDAAFGHHKLIEFPKDQLRFVKGWFDKRAKDGLQPSTLAALKSVVRKAFRLAIEAKLMPRPNPLLEFPFEISKAGVRDDDEGEEGRTAFPLNHLTDVIRGVTFRAHREHALLARTRLMVVLIGLLAGLRPGEICGLCWDAIFFIDRQIWVRRTVRKRRRQKVDGKWVGDESRWVLVASTKTGKGGFRILPMSPILFYALQEHKKWMAANGYSVEGDAPVVRIGGEELFTPESISNHQWPAIMTKAGFVDEEHGGMAYTMYETRHTFGCLLEASGLEFRKISKLMGHQKVATTEENYMHTVLSYQPILKWGKAVAAEYEIDLDTPEAYIHVIAVILHRHWVHAGIDLSWLGMDGADMRPSESILKIAATPVPASPGNLFIDLVPNYSVTSNGNAVALLTDESRSVAVDQPSRPVIKTAKELQIYQRTRAVEMHRAGAHRSQIMAELGIAPSTLDNHLRWANVEQAVIGRLPAIVRQAKIAQYRKLRAKHPDWSSTQLGKELGVEPKRVTLWAREDGEPMPHRPGAHKVGKYETEIMAMVGKKVGPRGIAEELKRRYPGQKTPSHSGISNFLKGKGVKLRNNTRYREHQEQIQALLDQKKGPVEVWRELGNAIGGSQTGMCRYIRSLMLEPPSEDHVE